MDKNKALDQTIKYLSSEAAIQSLERDPYWPKWNSPWWHMCLMKSVSFDGCLCPSLTKLWNEVRLK